MSHVPERSKALSLDLIVAIGLKNIFERECNRLAVPSQDCGSMPTIRLIDDTQARLSVVEVFQNTFCSVG